jgi:hypothetical protein
LVRGIGTTAGVSSAGRVWLSQRQQLGEKTMKSAIVLATVIAAVALGACRKEVPHEPMKLGGEVPVAERVAK